MTGPVLMAAVCEHMGWDYHTYFAQPTWFIELIIRKMEIDAKRQEQSAKRVK